MNFDPRDDWPFDEPRNCAVVTTRQILEGREPILLAAYDDDGWQFIGSSGASLSDARVVGLGEIVRHDPTVLQVAGLSPGWRAVRESVGGVWIRSPQTLDSEDER